VCGQRAALPRRRELQFLKRGVHDCCDAAQMRAVQLGSVSEIRGTNRCRAEILKVLSGASRKRGTGDYQGRANEPKDAKKFCFHLPATRAVQKRSFRGK